MYQTALEIVIPVVQDGGPHNVPSFKFSVCLQRTQVPLNHISVFVCFLKARNYYIYIVYVLESDVPRIRLVEFSDCIF